MSQEFWNTDKKDENVKTRKPCSFEYNMVPTFRHPLNWEFKSLSVDKNLSFSTFSCWRVDNLSVPNPTFTTETFSHEKARHWIHTRNFDGFVNRLTGNHSISISRFPERGIRITKKPLWSVFFLSLPISSLFLSLVVIIYFEFRVQRISEKKPDFL